MTNPNKVGLLFGILLGGWHLVWALVVLLGWAQPLIDFIFWAHMLQPIYVVKAFELKAAVTLILLTFTIGYASGVIGALAWNKLHQPK